MMLQYPDIIASIANNAGSTYEAADRAMMLAVASQVTGSTTKYLAGGWETTAGTAFGADDSIVVPKGPANAITVRFESGHYGRFAQCRNPETGALQRGFWASLSHATAAAANDGQRVHMSWAGLMPDSQPFETTVAVNGGKVFIPVDPALSGGIIGTLSNLSDATSGADLVITFEGGSVPVEDGAQAAATATRVAGFRPLSAGMLRMRAKEARAEDPDHDPDESVVTEGKLTARLEALMETAEENMAGAVADNPRAAGKGSGLLRKAFSKLKQAVKSPKARNKAKAKHAGNKAKKKSAKASSARRKGGKDGSATRRGGGSARR